MHACPLAHRLLPPLSAALLLLSGTLAGADDNAPGSGSDAADTPATTIDDVEARIRATTERLETLDAEIKSSRQLKDELVAAVAAAESKVGERQQRINGLDKDIARYNGKLDNLEQRIQAELAGVDARKSVLAESLRKAQRIGASTGLKVVLQHDDPALADRIGIYTDYLMKAQRRAIDEQLAALAAIEKAHATAVKDRNWLNHIKRKASSQYAAFANERENRREDLGQVETELGDKTRTVAQLQADQLRLQALMEELKALQAAQSGYFIQGQGTYPLPVAGTVEARYGELKSVGKIRWTGHFIRAAEGLPVHAIADGEVAYIGWLPGFGKLVIVDHGDGYMTLYAGNRDVMVEVGDWVDAGATLATVGNSDGQSHSGTYFEIRHDAQPVNPDEWLRPAATGAGAGSGTSPDVG